MVHMIQDGELEKYSKPSNKFTCTCLVRFFKNANAVHNHGDHKTLLNQQIIIQNSL